MLGLWGCAGAPKPAPPRAFEDAQRLALQAARLQADGSFAGAARAWQQAGLQFRLLNQLTNVALAWHNEAAARRGLGERDAAGRLLEQAAALNQELGATNAWWRNQLARIQLANDLEGDAAMANPLLRDLLQRELPAGDPALEPALRHEAARAALRRGELDEALTLADQALSGFASLDGVAAMAAVETTRGRILRRMGRLEEAEAAWDAARIAFETLGEPRGIAVALAGLGSCRAEQGRDPQAAQALLGRALENFIALGMRAEAEAVRAEMEPEAGPTTH